MGIPIMPQRESIDGLLDGGSRSDNSTWRSFKIASSCRKSRGLWRPPTRGWKMNSISRSSSGAGSRFRTG